MTAPACTLRCAVCAAALASQAPVPDALAAPGPARALRAATWQGATWLETPLASKALTLFVTSDGRRREWIGAVLPAGWAWLEPAP